LGSIPDGSRAAKGGSLGSGMINDETLTRVRALNEIAAGRGQSLAQLAISWALRDTRVTSALIGASSVAQLEQNLAAVQNLDFEPAELAAIEEHAKDAGINLWAGSSAVS
jgi:L-glyceraldehyde 3-phosphate reductase